MRVDQFIAKKFNLSRTKAQELIKSGAVQKKSKDNTLEILKQPSSPVEEGAEYSILDDQLIKYVSRSGLKLEGALKTTQLNVKNFKALDMGLSTGGFSECLLGFGAKTVVGVDVGHDQLHSKLKNQLEYYDGVNAKDLSSFEFMHAHLNSFDIVVIDVSFISLEFILPQAYQFLKDDGILLSLVKPQFELGAKALNKKGIVKDSALYKDLEEKIKQLCNKLQFKVLDYFKSPIEGGDGNQEFFVYAKK